jgi:hypothetical protein
MIKNGIINNIFSNEDFNRLKNHFLNDFDMSSIEYDDWGRKLVHSSSDPILLEYSQKLLPVVKDFFEDQSINPTYSMYAEYSDTTIGLHKHKDLNACQYTVDVLLHQTTQWPLHIEGVAQPLEENDALLFCGEAQEHWRELLENNSEKIGVVFFHFVDENHWWFTHGPDYVNVVRQNYRDRISNE